MADRLGVSPITLARRCNDVTPITEEMMLALAGVESERANPVSA
jgi:plasmid maintenance system antidote protein VapI